MTAPETTEITYHRLLKRQIRKSLSAELAENPEIQEFLASVNQAYLEFQDDMSRVEHILEQSSSELFKANRELIKIADEKTEEAASTNRRLEEVANSISEVLIQLNKDGKIIYLNNAWKKVTGFEISESLNKNWKEFHVSQDAQNTLNLLFTGQIKSIQETFILKTGDNKEKWLELTMSAQLSSKNDILGFIGTLSDITARKKQEAEINRMVDWFNESSEAVQVSDDQGKLLFINQEAARRLGKSQEEVIGTHISGIEKIFEDHAAWQEHVETLKGMSKMMINGVHKRQDGSTFPVEASVKYYESEGQGYILAFIQDISERVEAEMKLKSYMRDLERINAELDQFAYVVSHDLKAPLRAINNLSEWIEEDITDLLEGDTKDQFRLLRGRVHRMEGLINGILSYSRAGRIKTNKEKFLVKSVIDDLCETFSSKKQIEFKLEGNPDLEMVSEKITLIQILQNLISNGIKYNDKPDIEITIGWKNNNHELEFFVRDNGPGISPEFHDKIFVIFQTLQSRDEFESTGVGLAIVKKILDEKHARIWIESTMGIGTTFHFTWPALEKNEV
ncbi:PAS domain S-box protein [Dyadobacter sp. CY345]|uniref:PAS domain-containing sensor histidine kinase n=1 Tax=Dyadobacter sp. CY345 TaxID=2909335 RepID=UPI001F45BC94|nr:PAS domain-containing sensor histidine kinase [Dyadobacter sp. CY345]MCF2446266.1 PAS domain S-box protein [Dyadobacter sp. CY345]